MRDQGSDDQVFYWLGLNRLAVEQWGTESGRDMAVFRPGGDEAGPDPEDDGWDFMGTTPANSNMAYATDAQRGRTMRVWYSGGGTNYAEVVSGDIEGDDQNPNDTNWADGDHGHFSMWIRSAAPGDGFTMYVVARVLKNGTTPADVTFNITPLAGSPYTNGDHIVVPVGTHYMDGEWHYVEQDLLGIFEDLRPTWDFVQFDAMIVYAEDAYIDDIVLSGGSMARSYQVVPGMALGGTLAVQTGADGGEGVGAWETAYYHYNDLGTVLSTTDDSGDVVGAWVPDFNGNYTNPYLGGYKYTGSPDRPEIGLTGKWFDEAAGLYFFNARWLDPERARWMSEEPTGIDGPNLYHFVFSDSLNMTDPNGLQGGLHTALWDPYTQDWRPHGVDWKSMCRHQGGQVVPWWKAVGFPSEENCTATIMTPIPAGTRPNSALTDWLTSTTAGATVGWVCGRLLPATPAGIVTSVIAGIITSAVLNAQAAMGGASEWAAKNTCREEVCQFPNGRIKFRGDFMREFYEKN